MSIENKLNYLSTTKNLIKEAIKSKGVSVLDTDPFRDYANKINLIESGLPYTKTNTQQICDGNDLYEYDDYVVEIGGTQYTITGVKGDLVEAGAEMCSVADSVVKWKSTGEVQIQPNNVSSNSLSFSETTVEIDLAEYVEQGLAVYPLTSIDYLFNSQTNLKEVSHLPSLLGVTSAISPFYGCTSLVKLPKMTFSKSLIVMRSLLYNSPITELDLSGSDFTNCVFEDGRGFISQCHNFVCLYMDNVKGLTYNSKYLFFPYQASNDKMDSFTTVYMRGADELSIASMQSYLTRAKLTNVQIITE